MYKPQIGTSSRLPKAVPVPKTNKKESPRFGANLGKPYKKKEVVAVPEPVAVETPVVAEFVPDTPPIEDPGTVQDPAPVFDIDDSTKVEEVKTEGWKAKREKKKQTDPEVTATE